MSHTKDKIETFNGITVQHGKLNNRVYIKEIRTDNPAQALRQLEELARDQGYGKIFAKIPHKLGKPFLKREFQLEAQVPKLYEGKEDGLFLGKFLDEKRAEKKDLTEIKNILRESVFGERHRLKKHKTPERNTLRICRPDDSKQMAQVYSKVFPSYPFPITDPKFLEKTMQDNVVYFGIFDENNTILSLSSCEMDEENRNVEMTDFATLPEHRKKGHAQILLSEMEKEMQRRGIETAFTIARAISKGMNLTFSKSAYRYSGTLTNNTHISGKIESMNVWHKKICS